MILVRVILVLVISFYGNRRRVLGAVGITAGTLLAILGVKDGVYRNSYINLLESWFLFLLLAQSILATGNLTDWGLYICGTLAFITFLGILCSHLYYYLLKRHLQKLLYKIRVWRKKYHRKPSFNVSHLNVKFMQSIRINEFDNESDDEDINRRESLIMFPDVLPDND